MKGDAAGKGSLHSISEQFALARGKPTSIARLLEVLQADANLGRGRVKDDRSVTAAGPTQPWSRSVPTRVPRP